MQAPRGDERGGREARARVLRHRAHARASGRSSTWACSSRRSSSRSSSTCSAASRRSSRASSSRRRSCRPGSEWEVIGISHVPVADDRRRRSSSAATSARGSRTTSTCRTARWRSRTASSSRSRRAWSATSGARSATVERGAADPVARPVQARADAASAAGDAHDASTSRSRRAKAGARFTITLNYPERRNAIGPQMTNELLYALEDARADAAVRVVVFSFARKELIFGKFIGFAREPKMSAASLEVGKPVLIANR